jgi:hypothetical protein
MVDVPGRSSGILCRDYKGKEGDRLVTRIAPGVVSLVAELRSHERQAAKELEQEDGRRGAQALRRIPAAITLALLLTDEELDSLGAGRSSRPRCRAVGGSPSPPGVLFSACFQRSGNGSPGSGPGSRNHTPCSQGGSRMLAALGRDRLRQGVRPSLPHGCDRRKGRAKNRVTPVCVLFLLTCYVTGRRGPKCASARSFCTGTFLSGVRAELGLLDPSSPCRLPMLHGTIGRLSRRH